MITPKAKTQAAQQEIDQDKLKVEVERKKIEEEKKAIEEARKKAEEAQKKASEPPPAPVPAPAPAPPPEPSLSAPVPPAGEVPAAPEIRWPLPTGQESPPPAEVISRVQAQNLEHSLYIKLKQELDDHIVGVVHERFMPEIGEALDLALQKVTRELGASTPWCAPQLGKRSSFRSRICGSRSRTKLRSKRLPRPARPL